MPYMSREVGPTHACVARKPASRYRASNHWRPQPRPLHSPNSMPPPSFDIRLVSARPLSPSVRELSFVRVDGKPFEFLAGQWVSLQFPNETPGSGESRSYSIASAPDGTSRFDLAITHVEGGPSSTYLHRLEPGAVLSATGPSGFFLRDGEARTSPLLLVATGTGITPMRSFVEDAYLRKQREPIWLLLGVRREEDILYHSRLGGLVEPEFPFRFEVTLSQPDSSWVGRRGYVQEHTRELWNELHAATGRNPHVFVCGMERMVRAVRELLRKDMGLPRQLVHSERFD